MPNNKKYEGLIGVEVYLKRRKTRQYVGFLSKENMQFAFEYDHSYVYGRRAIPLGPDLPLSVKKFFSKKLFPTFEDRIPSKKNPAYKDYCKAVGIDPSEKDPILLVATLGQKGPSSFIFSPKFEQTFDGKSLIEFRRNLGLSTREFGDVFDFSPATISRIESLKGSGKDALKRLEIYSTFPQVAFREFKKNSFKINETKKEIVEQFLTQRINESK